MANEVPLRTVNEAMAELGISRSSVYRAVAAGQLEAWRYGERGNLRIAADSISQFLVPARRRSQGGGRT